MEEDLAASQLDGGRSPNPVKHDRHLTIKTEPSAIPRDPSPTSAANPNGDAAIAKAIALAQNEYSTRRVSKKPIIDRLLTPEPEIKANSDAEEAKTASTSAPTKKRPAPKGTGSNTKAAPVNGIKKPPPKKRKLEHSTSEDRATPTSTNRSSTPASVSAPSRAGKTKSGSRKPSLAGTPASSSPAPAGSPAPMSEPEAGSDGEEYSSVYCICRRPDNHTWMVACDGGCDDWFHGKCVNIVREDQDLIDKYICPNCTANGRGVTTWKPMCRRDGCRRPARLRKGAHSKYCSDECGVMFMKDKTANARMAAAYVARNSTDEKPDLGPLGGAIRAHELKTLALAAPDAETFRSLGDLPTLKPFVPASPELQQNSAHLPTKPASTDPGGADPVLQHPTTAAAPSSSPPVQTQTQTRLTQIALLKTALRTRRALLKDRDRFVTLAKDRAAKLAVATKLKDICGYDPRLSWGDATFSDWRQSKEGVAAFMSGSLEVKMENGKEDGEDGGVHVKSEEKEQERVRHDVDHGNANANGRAEIDPNGNASVNSLCYRRRCQRHKEWQKVALHDVRFEEAETRIEMKKVDEEERGIRDGGLVLDDDGGGGGNGEVEVVEEDAGNSVRTGDGVGDGVGDERKIEQGNVTGNGDAKGNENNDGNGDEKRVTKVEGEGADVDEKVTSVDRGDSGKDVEEPVLP